MHMQALPTQTELMHQTFVKRKDDLKGSQRSRLLDKYGADQTVRLLHPNMHGACIACPPWGPAKFVQLCASRSSAV